MMQLIRANPILAGVEHPHGSEPLIQPDRIVLKDDSDIDRELLLAGPAPPEEVALQVLVVFVQHPAGGANTIVQPADLCDVFGSHVQTGEMANGF
jgi:hypothetical protein